MTPFDTGSLDSLIVQEQDRGFTADMIGLDPEHNLAALHANVCRPLKHARLRTWQVAPLLMVLLVLAGSVTGCSTRANNAESLVSVDDECLAALPLMLPPPLRTVFHVDFSGSSETNPTPRLWAEDLKPVVDYVVRFGGSVAVGRIDEHSSDPLLRIDVEAPPDPPRKPTTGENIFLDRNSLHLYDDSLRVYKKSDATRCRDAQERARVFLRDVDSLLHGPRDAQETNLWNAIRRGERLLLEPETPWPRPPREFHVVISDAEDTVGAASVDTLVSGATLVVIYGVDPDPVLYKFDPVEFAAIAPAMAYLVRAR